MDGTHEGSSVFHLQGALLALSRTPATPGRMDAFAEQETPKRGQSGIRPDEVAAAVERARHDPAAFAELYDAYFERVYGYVAARVGSRSDAEDVVAETFVRALDALGRFEYRGPGSFGAWLFRLRVGSRTSSPSPSGSRSRVS